MDYNAYWNRVRKLIKAHNISVEEFAKYIHIPRSTFYAWLRHERSPEIGSVYNIATALGVSVEFLVTGEDEKSAAMRMEQTKTRKTAAVKIKKLVGELQNEMGKI
jgi:transcriptional regulator with XRE-family HTH domain